MNLEILNKTCGKMVNIYHKYNRNWQMYDEDMIYKMEDILDDNEVITNRLNKELLKKVEENSNKYLNIYMYAIIFKEDLIDDDILLKLIDLEKLDYFDVFCMEKELNDEIISKLLYKIDEEKDYLGLKNNIFDYRYHILKRKNISDYTLKQVLDLYNKDELESIYNTISFDLENDILYNKYDSKEKIKKEDLDLYHQFIVFRRIDEYLKQKVLKK